MKLGRYATAVITHGDRLIRVDDNANFTAMPSQRLVDGVIHQFEDHVVEPSTVVGVTYIHTWPLTHCVQPLEHLDA